MFCLILKEKNAQKHKKLEIVITNNKKLDKKVNIVLVLKNKKLTQIN